MWVAIVILAVCLAMAVVGMCAFSAAMRRRFDDLEEDVCDVSARIFNRTWLFAWNPDGSYPRCADAHKDVVKREQQLWAEIERITSVLTPSQRKKLDERRAVGRELDAVEAYRKQNKG